MHIQSLNLPGNPEPQDRIEIFSDDSRLIIALADGAGGISGGARAADLIIQITRDRAASLLNPDACQSLLLRADQLISDDPVAGETTAIILVLRPGEIFGASVGDSEAWLFSPPQKIHLTKSQQRKPLLGSGEIEPVAFTHPSPTGQLIVATDGLWKYTSHQKIAAEVDVPDISTLPERLGNLVRLRSGALQDDLALAVVSF